MTQRRKVRMQRPKTSIPKALVKAAEVVQLEREMRKLKSRANTPFADVGSHLGGIAGSFFGNGEFGRSLGKSAGSFIGKILGSGDYKTNFDQIKNNSFITAGPPGFGGGNNITMFTHREFIQDVVSASTANTFKITTFPINPAQEFSYPWLATLAQNFEEYEIVGQIYEFRSTSADALNSTNTALGTVILATQYDPTKNPFASKFEMENYEFAVSIKPSQSVMHAIECKNELTPVTRLYTRPGAQASATDLRWTDFGNFSIATTGMQAANVVVGELWVSYQIKCYKPRIPATVGGTIQSYHEVRSGNTSAAPLGTIGQVFKSGSLSSVVTVTSTVISWIVEPDSQWYFTLLWDGIANSGMTTPGATFTNCSRKNNPNGFNNQSNSDLTCTASSSSGTTLSYSSIIVPNSSANQSPVTMTITFNGSGVLPLSTCFLDIYITQLDGSVNA